MLPYLPFSLIVSKAGWCNRSFRYQKFDIVGFVCHKAWEMPRRIKFFFKEKVNMPTRTSTVFLSTVKA